MIEAADSPQILSKRDAICTAIPYAISLEQDGQQGMINAISRAASASTSRGFIWYHLESYIMMLFNKPNSPSLNRVITLVLPHVSWNDTLHMEDAVARWVAAVSAVPCTEEVCQSVVDMLLQVASDETLRPRIPFEIWEWLKKRPYLPPVCRGRFMGIDEEVVKYVRRLGDVEVLKSYLLLVWSEWDPAFTSAFQAMEISLREDFCGTEMWRHQEELSKGLDYVLGQLDRGSEYLGSQHPAIYPSDIQWAKVQYRRLKDVLLEVEMQALARTFLHLTPFNPCPNFCGRVQDPIRPSAVPCLSRGYDFRC